MADKRTQPLAVITGGASGIGFSAVKRFLDEGYEVLILDANKDAGDQSVNSLKSDTCNVNFVYCDITDHAQIDTFLPTCMPIIVQPMYWLIVPVSAPP